MSTHEPKSGGEGRGPITWMARHPVAANLVMLALIAGGLLVSTGIRQEVFPEIDLDIITVGVAYPGTSPAEVERGIVLAVEEEVSGLEGIKRVTSSSREGSASVTLELLDGADKNRVLGDVKSAVDRIRSFPEDAEKPVVSLATTRKQVISLAIYGDLGPHDLRALGEQAREELLEREEISQVEVAGLPSPEIAVEVPQERLRELGLTLDTVARQVGNTAVEVPGGGVRTGAGEVLVRLAERRDHGEDFADVPVVTGRAGGEVQLEDVAEIHDAFEETDESATFWGQPAVLVEVYRTGDEAPIEVADAVKSYADQLGAELPEGVGVTTWRDDSQVLRERIDLLMRNAWMGLALVLLVLGLFLETRLAFWVTMGIPISFLGAMILMPSLGVTINMVSLFAFIVTLGLVVDDAIVVGENVYRKRQEGMGPLEAAMAGTREMATPITFSILTSIAAFSPLFFVPGFMGKIFAAIPAVVVSVLLLSLFESVFVLPNHLGHLKRRRLTGLRGILHGAQQRFARLVEWLIDRSYRPTLRLALRFRYVTVAVATGLLLLTAGYVGGGHIRFEFMPRVESDTVAASVTLPYGAAVGETEKVRDRLLDALDETIEAHGGRDLVRGVYANVGAPLAGGGPHRGGASERGGHLANVMVQLVPSGQRDFGAVHFVDEWRRRAGRIPGVETLSFDSALGGPSAGAPIDIRLAHDDLDTLEQAAAQLASALERYDGVSDVDPGFSRGKPQLDLTLKPAARAAGLSPAELGGQLRAAFQGAEAVRQQRDRDDMRVLVRLPSRQRSSEHDIESLIVRTPDGGEIPLHEAASVERGRAYTEIRRAEGRRVLDVTADVEDGGPNANEILRALQEDELPALQTAHAGLSWSLEGENREQADAMQSLLKGFGFALLIIFGLLAIPFRSWSQPFIVMVAIPFGPVGAVIGHVLMGFDLSVVSMMGIVALSGVVVNDSLVLVDATNRLRARGQGLLEAVENGGVLRFRPILLTSLTTFGGLAPMMFETSVQARFLIPMALSLGWGVLFATFILLLLVPSLYLVVEDLRRLAGAARGACSSTRAIAPIQEPR